MKRVNMFLTNLGSDKVLLALFGGVLITGGALITLTVALVVWCF